MDNRDGLLCFEPLDTFFFRDGRPYTQGESEQADVASLFPPSPSTLVGALRAAAARAMGWNGRGAWDTSIHEALGDGLSLGPLRCRGPWLRQHGEILYPLPANLCIDASEQHTALLQPGPGRDCDLGDGVRLPTLPSNAPKVAGWKPATDHWLTAQALEQALQAEPPVVRSIIRQHALWSPEARVGIERNASTRTTEEGALYSPRHIRLTQATALCLQVHGLSNQVLAQLAQQPHPLGGESRLAWITPVTNPPPIPPMAASLQRVDGSICFTLNLTTPLPLAAPPHPGGNLSGVPGTIVSACLPRPQMLGGWDSLAQRPLPLVPHLVPGSVFFMQADAAQEMAVRALHGTCIGTHPAWGWGHVLVGTWKGD